MKVSASGSKGKNILLMLLAWVVLQDCVEDAHDLGVEEGYQWGFENGRDEGTMSCPVPFVMLENG